MGRSRSSTLSENADGVRLRGPIGEIWADGRQLGLVYEWSLVGWQAKWRLEAERYKLDALAVGIRNVELRLDMRIGIVRAKGVIWTDPVCDGHSHRAIIVKGGKLRWQKKSPVETPQ